MVLAISPSIAPMIIAAVLAVPGSAQNIIDRVLASVDRAIITQSDVYGAIRLGLVRTDSAADPVGVALERLIERRLTLNEADRYGPPEPTVAEIDRRVAEITAAFTPAALDAILAESGLTREGLRRYVRDDLRIAAYLDQRFGGPIQPSEDEILKYYEEHRATFTAAGVARPFAESRDAARDALIQERRNAAIAEWLATIRKRANVSVVLR